MCSKILVARLSSTEPMGQELADAALVAGLLRDPSPPMVEELRVVGCHDDARAARRLPVTRLQTLPWAAQLATGAWVYRCHRFVHRLDLRLPPAPEREIVTIQDLAPLRFPDEGDLPPFTGRAIRRAAAVVCPSAFSAREIRREFDRNDVEVIPHGHDPAFLSAQPLSAGERSDRGLPERWVIHTGGATLRKNLRALAEAWPSVHERHPDVSLLLCGPPDPRRNALFHNLPSVRLLGKVPRPVLVQLMASAAAVVVPSEYEGYGLPALEAMAARVPLVARRAASLPEVAGCSSILVGDGARALADGLCRALQGIDPSALDQAREVARARNWAAAARAYKQVYERVFERACRLLPSRPRSTP